MKTPFLRPVIGIVKSKLGKKVPLKVEHICTYTCNLRCNYCKIWKEKTKELNTKEVKEMMDVFSKLGTISWNFTGGEPLLRQDIEELVDYLKNKGIHITLNTNGILIKKNINWLHKVDLLGISFDGPQYIQEKTRGKESYQTILEGIDLCLKNKINVYICTVISKANLENNCKGIKDMLNFSLEKNIPISFLPIFEDSLNKGTINSLKSDKTNFLQGIKILTEFKKKYPKLLMMSPSTLKWLSSKMDKINCRAGKDFITIYPDGQISQCMFMPKIKTNKRYATAYKKLKKIGKINCFKDGFHCQLCYLEYNNLFSLKPETIKEYLNHS